MNPIISYKYLINDEVDYIKLLQVVQSKKNYCNDINMTIKNIPKFFFTYFDIMKIRLKKTKFNF